MLACISCAHPVPSRHGDRIAVKEAKRLYQNRTISSLEYEVIRASHKVFLSETADTANAFAAATSGTCAIPVAEPARDPIMLQPLREVRGIPCQAVLLAGRAPRPPVFCLRRMFTFLIRGS